MKRLDDVKMSLAVLVLFAAVTALAGAASEVEECRKDAWRTWARCTEQCGGRSTNRAHAHCRMDCSQERENALVKCSK